MAATTDFRLAAAAQQTAAPVSYVGRRVDRWFGFGCRLRSSTCVCGRSRRGRLQMMKAQLLGGRSTYGPSQWERAIFDPPQLGDPSTDFHET